MKAVIKTPETKKALLERLSYVQFSPSHIASPNGTQDVLGKQEISVMQSC